VTRIKLIGAAGLAIAAVTALPAAPAGGTSDIVYRCGPGFSNLCRIDPTSGAVTQLTRDGKPAGPLYAEPSYSRDGKKMTYTFGNDLYVARGDATHRRLLERRVVLDRLSPDGNWVTLAKILPDPVGGPCPGFICVGRSIPYLFIRPAGPGKLETVARAVATVGWWRSRLMIDQQKSVEEGQSICLLRTNTDFHCARDLAVDPIRDLWGPAGSPNGRYIAAAAAPRPGPNETTTKLDGYIALYSAGTAQLVRNLTHGQHDSYPTWSPDGSLIAFNRGHSIYVIHADGSDAGRPRLLVRSGIQPTWGA
jgi:hypothetical protein